jgi:hypothetical protein
VLHQLSLIPFLGNSWHIGTAHNSWDVGALAIGSICLCKR